MVWPIVYTSLFQPSRTIYWTSAGDRRSYWLSQWATTSCLPRGWWDGIVSTINATREHGFKRNASPKDSRPYIRALCPSRFSTLRLVYHSSIYIFRCSRHISTAHDIVSLGMSNISRACQDSINWLGRKNSKIWECWWWKNKSVHTWIYDGGIIVPSERVTHEHMEDIAVRYPEHWLNDIYRNVQRP